MSGKKLTILAILEILRRYTDADHRLRQSEIIDLLGRDYDMTATRKTVRENLALLQDMGYPLECSNGWYYEHKFSEAELDLLIHGLLFNSYIPPVQSREMIEKLKSLASEHYKPRTFYDRSNPSNPQFLYTLEIVQDAIEKEKKIEFQYAHYDVDKRLHPRLDAQWEPRIYCVSPYRIAMANGRYYLIGNMARHDDITHFRLDRIIECRETESPVRPVREVHGLENGLHIPDYMAGRAYMFSGRQELVRIRAKRYLVGDILDWFGMDVRFEKVTDDDMEAVFRADELSLKYWLRQYGEHAERID